MTQETNYYLNRNYTGNLCWWDKGPST